MKKEAPAEPHRHKLSQHLGGILEQQLVLENLDWLYRGLFGAVRKLQLDFRVELGDGAIDLLSGKDFIEL